MKITTKELNDAATAHAKSVLGDQFKSNPDAVKAVKSDWKAGAQHILKLSNRKGVQS